MRPTASSPPTRETRGLADIHVPIDNEMRALGGGMIGRLVVARAREDSIVIRAYKTGLWVPAPRTVLRR